MARAALEEQWDDLDEELARSLVARGMSRAKRNRPSSPCDAIALALRRARTALCSVAYGIRDGREAEEEAPPWLHGISPAYLWCIRIAHELEAIELAEHSPDGDWTRIERFAPLALASHETLTTSATMFEGPWSSEISEALTSVCHFFDLARASSAAAA